MNAIIPKKVTPTIIKLDPQKEIPIIGVKIVEEQYAQAFVQNGVIHFSNPKTWRDSNICSGKQLDEDEGCFCFSLNANDEPIKRTGRKFKKYHANKGWKYFEDTELVVASCFYGIRKSDFHESVMKYGVKEIKTKDYTVKTDYFRDFYASKDEQKGKKTIIIFDFYKFLDLIKKTLINMGVKESELFLSTVYYVDKKGPFYTIESFPFEYLLKDASFVEQAEFRILIASSNKQFYKKLNETDYNIEIGNISSFTVIQDYYGIDLDFSIQGDELVYKLPHPITLTLEDRSFSELVVELYQIQQNQLPGEPKGKDELDALAKPIIEHLKIRYGVEYRDDWRLYNVPYKEYLTLPDIHKGLCETIAE